MACRMLSFLFFSFFFLLLFFFFFSLFPLLSFIEVCMASLASSFMLHTHSRHTYPPARHESASHPSPSSLLILMSLFSAYHYIYDTLIAIHSYWYICNRSITIAYIHITYCYISCYGDISWYFQLYIFSFLFDAYAAAIQLSLIDILAHYRGFSLPILDYVIDITIDAIPLLRHMLTAIIVVYIVFI